MATTKRLTGTVKRIVQDKGFGFIAGPDQVERFFHRSAIGADFVNLREGETVSFEEEASQKGPRATKIQREDE